MPRLPGYRHKIYQDMYQHHHIDDVVRRSVASHAAMKIKRYKRLMYKRCLSGHRHHRHHHRHQGWYHHFPISQDRLMWSSMQDPCTSMYVNVTQRTWQRSPMQKIAKVYKRIMYWTMYIGFGQDRVLWLIQHTLITYRHPADNRKEKRINIAVNLSLRHMYDWIGSSDKDWLHQFMPTNKNTAVTPSSRHVMYARQTNSTPERSSHINNINIITHNRTKQAPWQVFWKMIDDNTVIKTCKIPPTTRREKRTKSPIITVGSLLATHNAEVFLIPLRQ